jgi:heptosyltransferase I
MPDAPRRILVIKPSAMGDIVHALPFLSSLRASFPAARISWLVRPAFAPLLQCTPLVNEILLFDRNRLGHWWFNPGSAADLMRFLGTLRSSHFDCVFDLQGLFRTALFSRWTGCPNRYGFQNAREGAWRLYSHRVALPDDCVHVIDTFWQMARAAGATVRHNDYGLQAPEDAQLQVRQLLQESEIARDSIAILVPGSAQSWKCWPLDRFVALAERIYRELGLSVVVVGSQGERSLGEEIALKCQVPIVNLAGRTDITQLIALMAVARVVVSNDTGPGHIAVAVGTPTAMIFGPTNPARVGPYGKPEWVAAVNPFGRGTIINDFDSRYRIETISVEQVLEILRRQVGNSSG